MSEYISREAALQFVFDACAECMDACEEFDGIYADCNQCMLEGVKLKLRDLPAADVRPVVLCGECKYSHPLMNNCKKCSYWSAHGLVVADHDFCSHGERREGS